MKREELKEKIGDKLKTLLGMAYFESDTEEFMYLIDEYTKPKTKKNINGATRLPNKDRRETRKLKTLPKLFKYS